MEPSVAWSRTTRLLAWGWTILIFVVLWIPPPPPPEVVLWWYDKAVHFALLLGFGGLWTWHGLRGRRLWPWGVVVGAASEAGQGLLPWRHCSGDDFAFDVAGLLVGGALARLLWPRPAGARPPWW